MSLGRIIVPPATVGIVGGGQLGRMSALAARAMGYRVIVLEPKEPCACGPVADEHIVAAYDEGAALARLFDRADVVTFEFENVRREPLEAFAERKPVRPSPKILSVAQNREREKAFLSGNGFPVAPYRIISSDEDVKAVIGEGFPFPAILKTADFGYDGKGQVSVNDAEAMMDAWKSFEGARAVLEERIEFEAEYSVIVVRNPSGALASYPLCRNIHRDHILDVTLSPAEPPGGHGEEAQSICRDIADTLGLEGVLAVELFLAKDGSWLVNEMAPRPHNSGHFSIDGSETSQFENHVRAVCNLPLGATGTVGFAAMQNLLGETLIELGDGLTPMSLRAPGSHLHLYDKGEARAGRKMGHINLRADERSDLIGRLVDLRKGLGLPPIRESVE